jgi:hypothetical protein
MVKIQGPTDYERLDAIVRRLVAEHGLQLDVTGWTRKTYDVYTPTEHLEVGDLLARVESFVTTSGEITVYDDRAMAFATALGTEIEREFGIPEATIVKKSP